MTSPMPSLPPLNSNNNQAMNDNNELVEATISYMNTMPPLPHNQPPQQLHNTVSPASRHEGQQHYNNRQQQRTSHHHQYHNQYHPYSRPPTTNTPYNQEYGGYEGYYQNNNKMASYPMPPRQHQHQVSPHEGSPHPQYQSPMPPYQANNMMMQQRHPPTIITTTKSPSLPSKSSSKSSKSKSKSIKSALASNSKVKKPPRSYTEYNIFFQLERERILGNLIEEQELKKKTGGEDKGDDKEDEKEGVESGKGDEDEKDKDVASQDTNKDNNKEEDDDEDKPYPTIDTKGRPLNIPSDSNDILPRPPRFAHLQLSPLWYDSTHRLAESKRNKAKRKHRKTHGLVGFLELTKMIAKEWKVVDSITKSYCKRVADRQLVLYKEEMKVVKKKQQLEEQEMMLNVVGGEDSNTSGSGKSSKKKQKKDERTPMQLQQMLRIQESTAPKLEVIVKYDKKDVSRYPHQEYRDHQGGTVRHSYPPPPPSQYWSPRFVQQQQQVGPPPQFRNEREGPSGYSSQRSIPQGYQQQYGHQGRPSSSSNRQHYSPPSSNLPPLTPDSQFPMNDHHHGVSSSGNGNNNGNLLTPLDELNRRRALYGAQAAAIEAKSKFRSPGTSRLERAMRGQGGGSSSTSVNNRALISGKIQQDKVSSASYLSPADQGGVAMSAVTPSPSRRTAGLVIGASPDASSESSSPSASTGTVTDKGAPPSNTVDGSMTPSQLPMKKRRKKLLEENSEVDIDSDIKKNNKDTTSSKPGLPIRHSSVNSIGGFLSSPGFGFQLSPGSMGMMTPGGGNGTFGSPTQYHKALVGPYLNDNEGGMKSSPFPYIDWSPQESSPQDTDRSGKPSLATREHSRGVVPPHLGVPGGYHHAHGHHPIQYRHPGNMLGPHNGMSPGIGFADEGALDLDEEEMKLMWSKMATTAKRKRVASRDQAAAWMYGQYGGPMGSFAASPGGGGMMSWAHSFSSPGNLGGRPDILARGMSNGSVMKKEETISAHAESNGEEKTEAGKKTELPSLTEV